MLIPRKVKYRKQHHPGRSGQATGGTKVSLMLRAEIQRTRLSGEPALSFVPEARPPPKGC